MSDSDNVDPQFEFERKFLVRVLPGDVVRYGPKQVIIQAYVLAADGCAVRVRVSLPGRSIECPAFDEAMSYLRAYERRLLTGLLADARGKASASMAVRSSAVQGECYEMGPSLDLAVTTQIIWRCSTATLKNRHSLWYDGGGQESDMFTGQNEGPIMVECKWLAPVVDLKVPEFCVTEVFDNVRFTNDYLSKEPWRHRGPMYVIELAAHGPYFVKVNGNGGRPGKGAG